jgi:hypothetical protein
VALRGGEERQTDRDDEEHAVAVRAARARAVRPGLSSEALKYARSQA